MCGNPPVHSVIGIQQRVTTKEGTQVRASASLDRPEVLLLWRNCYQDQGNGLEIREKYVYVVENVYMLLGM